MFTPISDDVTYIKLKLSNDMEASIKNIIEEVIRINGFTLCQLLFNLTGLFDLYP